MANKSFIQMLCQSGTNSTRTDDSCWDACQHRLSASSTRCHWLQQFCLVNIFKHAP